MGLRLQRQATRHLRLAPTRLAHAPPRILGPRLHAASVQHHHGRSPRRLLVVPFQPTLAKLLHLLVTQLDPFLPDTFAQPLQMGRTDLDLRQLPHILAGLNKGGRLARLANPLLHDRGTIPFRAQLQANI